MRAFKIAIILLGRPGSGKDTQAELLAKKFGLVHIISSKIIKKALVLKQREIKLDGKIYNVQKERENLHNGRLTTFTFVSALISNEIRSIFKKKKGIIMSGSSRSKTEFEKEWPILKKLYGDKNVFIFHIWISPKEVYVRNLKRHRKDLPELDTKKVIDRRLKMFNKYTLPVIKFLEKQKKIIEINGEQSIMKIHQDILWQLQSKQKKK
ncbi:MAG: nucleoside monophosphate kinase [Parcubacteria group bacterium]|nr:nucleoside monophosphate kinase [Parcubacteria group bacterium]